MENTGEFAAGSSVAAISAVAQRLREALGNVIFGQDRVIDLILIGLLSEGHLLLEGIPGTAKTTLIKTLAQLIQLDFRRVQLTPDMLPAEIVGTSIFDLNSRNFVFKKGPVFTDLLLADEINRTPPKTQSALLEAMEEQQVTVDGERHPLSEMFTVIATLNPVEFEGTYPLPEAQLDRFMMKIAITYPEPEAEKHMLSQFAKGAGSRFFLQHELSPVSTRAEILSCRRGLAQVTVEDALLDYVLGIARDTRENPAVELGASPRAALSLLGASRAHAAIGGRGFVTPDDVKEVAQAVLCHRLVLTADAELDGLTPDHVIKQSLNKVPVPR